jgi:microcystin-dependent protein
MNKIDFTQPGGFPLTQDTLGFLQSAYTEVLGGLAAFLGDKVILSGCTISQGIVQPGVVAVDGEILYTPGGTYLSPVYVDEQTEQAMFEDGKLKGVYKMRTLRFGTGSPSWSWELFKRLSRIIDMAAGLVPAGAIMMWFGEAASVPAGWVICDGENGTPNMKGRFPLGVYGAPISGQKYNLGQTGGEAFHTLATYEMPRHTHEILDLGHTHDVLADDGRISSSIFAGKKVPTLNSQSVYSGYVSSATTGISVHYEGMSIAHNNMPPYLALYFIMKK